MAICYMAYCVSIQFHSILTLIAEITKLIVDYAWIDSRGYEFIICFLLLLMLNFEVGDSTTKNFPLVKWIVHFIKCQFLCSQLHVNYTLHANCAGWKLKAESLISESYSVVHLTFANFTVKVILHLLKLFECFVCFFFLASFNETILQ